MAYEKAGVELELSKAEAYISNAKQAAAATDLLYSSIGKLGGVNITSLNAFSSTMKDLVKVGQDAGKSAQQAGTEIVEVGAKASSSSHNFGDLVGKVKDVAGGFLNLGGSAVGALVSGLGNIGGAAVSAAKGLLDVGSAAAGAAWSGVQKLGSMALDAGKWLVELGAKAVEAGAKFAISFGKDAVQAAMEFDKQMSEVASVSNATPAQLAKMSDEALRLGAVFPVSATDAAKAMTELGKAGFTTDQILSASTGTVQLASATHYSMADSATVLANAINQFGLKADQAGRVTDLFAAAANASAVDVKDLAKTFEYAGPVAQAAGFSIEDVAKATAVMGNAGIKGSSAGTGLKAVLASLVAPGDKAAAAFEKLGFKSTDANGKMKPLQEQLVDLRGKFKGLSSQEQIDLATKIVGVNHFPKLLALMNTTDESFNQVSDAIDNASGAGARMAETMNDNLAGALENLKGSFETLQIKVGKAFQPILKDLANLGSMLIGKIIPYVDTFAKKFQDSYGKIRNSINDLKKGWDLFTGAFNNEQMLVPKGLSGLAGTMHELGIALAPIKKAFSDLVTAIMPAATGADAMAEAMKKSGGAASTAHPVIDAIASLVKNILVPGIEGAARTIDNMQLAFSKLQGVIGPVLPQAGDFAKKAWDIYQAISPLNIGLDVFNGIMTGGLGGGIDAVGQHVTDLGNAFGVDLSGPVSTVTGFLKTDLIPAVEGIAKGFGEALPGIIEFGQGILNQVLPPVQSFIGWVGEHVGPVVQSAFNTFQTDVLPDLQDFAGFIGDEVMPKVGDLIKFVAEKVGPILEKGFGVLSETVIPTIGKLVGVITKDVMPILFSWWNILATALQPAFETAAWAVSNVLLPAIEGIWKFINDPLIPIFQNIAAIVKDPVMKIFQDLANLFNTVVKGAIDKVVEVWNGLLEAVQKGANVIGKVAKGDWAGAWDELTNTAKTGAQDTVKEIDKIATTIANKDYSASAAAAGKTISTGMAAGIKEAAGNVVAAARSIAQQAIDAAKSKLNSQSPSKVFIGIGEDVGAGFAIGLDNNSGLVVDRMVDLVGNTNKVIEDKRDLFKWNIKEYFSPVSDTVHDLDETNPIINATLKEMLKGFSQTVVEQAGGFKTALDGFISPVSGMKDRLGTTIGQVKTEVDTSFTNVNQTVKDHNGQIVEDMKVLPDTVEKTGQDVAGAGSGSNSPAGAMQSVLDSVSQAVDAGTTTIIGKLQALLAQINALLAQIGQAAASLPAMGGAGGGSGTGQAPSSDMPGGNRTANPTGGGAGAGNSGGTLLPSPASAQQISNIYSNASTTNNAPVVINNNPIYNMPLNVAPMPVATVQQSYIHAMAMLPN